MKRLMLALPQGDSYLGRPDIAYSLFVYRLGPERGTQILLPVKHQVHSRLYPNVIGTIAQVGDILVIARTNPRGGVDFAIGYIGVDFLPVFFAHHPYNSRNDVDWNTESKVGLAWTEKIWIKERIDPLTKAAVTKNNKRLEKLLRDRECEEARARKALQAKRAATQAKREATIKRKQAYRDWAYAVLENLVAIEKGIKEELRFRAQRALVPSELDLLAQEWNWL